MLEFQHTIVYQLYLLLHVNCPIALFFLYEEAYLFVFVVILPLRKHFQCCRAFLFVLRWLMLPLHLFELFFYLFLRLFGLDGDLFVLSVLHRVWIDLFPEVLDDDFYDFLEGRSLISGCILFVDGVEAVLDHVFRSGSGHGFGDGGPTLSEMSNKLKEPEVFF